MVGLFEFRQPVPRRGFRWLAAELGSEAATLGSGGLLVVLAFALPSLEVTNDPAWRTASQYSVTFLDRNGQRSASAASFSDSRAAGGNSRIRLIKATLATEDRRFFDHFGIDVFGTFRALADQLRPMTWCRAAAR